MSKLANALKKKAEVTLPRNMKLEGLTPGTYEGSATFPVTEGWLSKLVQGKVGGQFDVGDDGAISKFKGEARVAPTTLGYGAGAAAGAGIGGGIGALVSDNRLVGGLTGAGIGAVAAPLALLIASKQGMLGNLSKTAEGPHYPEGRSAEQGWLGSKDKSIPTDIANA